MPGKDDQSDEHWTLEVLNGSKSVVKAATYGYLLSCKWSADGKLVAINNRRANSGDYVWVVDLEEGRVIKSPEDKLGESWGKVVDDKNPDAKRADVGQSWITAMCWEKGTFLRYRVAAKVTGNIDLITAEGIHVFERSHMPSSNAPKTDEGAAIVKNSKKIEANKNEIICDGQVVKNLRFRYLDDGPKLFSGGPSTESVIRLFAWKMPIATPKGTLDASPKEMKIERGKVLYAKSIRGVPDGEKLFPVRITFMPWRLNRAAPEGFTVQGKFFYFKNEFDKWDFFEE